MLIEGRNAIREAFGNNVTINKVMVDKNFQGRRDEILALASAHKVKVEFLPRQILDKKSKTAHHQGFIAECVDFVYSSVEEILEKAKEKNEDPFIVLLDGIEDPHNFGAIIRSCECAGVHGIIIPKNRACQVNETVIRSSTGAISNMLISKVTNLKDAISILKDNDIWIYGAEASGENIYDKTFTGGVAVIIGSEGKGIKPSILSQCDSVLALSMKGKVNSLNASVACGIILFEILRGKK